MQGRFVVIGLGVFGRNIALDLAHRGHSVLAVDVDEEEVARVADELDAAVAADATDQAALEELRLESATCVVVAIGAEAMEASILTTALVRQLGVPRIVARALSELHARVLYAVGAHEVVSPEEEMGRRVARRLSEPSVLERLELGENVQVAELEAPSAFAGSSLIDLDLRREHGLSVIAIRRQGEVHAAVGGDFRLADGDVLFVIGSSDAIQRLAELV